MRTIRMVFDATYNGYWDVMCGEHEATEVTMDCASVLAQWPEARFTVVVRRKDGAVYPPVAAEKAVDGELRYALTSVDTGVAGPLVLEFRAYAGVALVKTRMCMLQVVPGAEITEVPEPSAPGWIEQVAEDKVAAEVFAKAAAESAAMAAIGAESAGKSVAEAAGSAAEAARLVEGFATQEADRVQAEEEREHAESLRAREEEARKDAEGSRESNNAAWKQAEGERVDSEGTREQAEEDRQAQEAARQEATAAVIQRAGDAAALLEGLTVEAQALPAGAEPTVDLAKVGGAYRVDFGIPDGNVLYAVPVIDFATRQLGMLIPEGYHGYGFRMNNRRLEVGVHG